MKLKSFLLCHILIALLIGTFIWPYTQVYWDKIDLFFFHLLNDPMKGNKFLQIFWALNNHRWADWIEDFVILGFFIAYVRRPSSLSKTRKIAQLVFMTLFIAAVIFFVNRVLFRENLRIHRDSPTLIVENCLHLSDQLDWLRIKDESPKCFPADHATTALLFAFMYFFYARGRAGILAIIYGIFLCLPRMATGAHWLSDVLVGSGSIILFLLSWALCTPIHLWFTNGLERLFCLFQKKKIKSQA